MNSTTVLAIVVPVLVVLALVVVFTTVRRRDTAGLGRETRKRDKGRPASLAADTSAEITGRDYEKAALIERSSELVPVGDTTPVPWVAPDPEVLGVTRRQFMNRGIVTLMLLGISGFGAAILAFLWPGKATGFGGKITVGKISALLEEVASTKLPAYRPEARAYINPFPAEALEKAKAAGYDDRVMAGLEAGVIVLAQKCPHLGCRVPWCATSQWFECPCHGSQYNRVGEKKGGPAPRGMDQWATTVDNGVLTIDTGSSVSGLAIGTNTTGQEAEGPHCLSSGEH